MLLETSSPCFFTSLFDHSAMMIDQASGSQGHRIQLKLGPDGATIGSCKLKSQRIEAASVTPGSRIQKCLQNLCIHSTVHIKMVNMVNLMLCVFYHNFQKVNKPVHHAVPP